MTRRLDDGIPGPGNIKRLSSVSRSGRAALTVEFREGIDPYVAVSDVQHRASAVERDLPADANQAHGGVRHMREKECQKR